MHGVTVRNLSATGARLELEQAPPVGSEVELERGSLAATGKIVWIRAGACGLRFDTPILLEKWVPSAAQQRVDQAVVDLKSGTRLEEKLSIASAVTASDMNRRIAEELGFVARKLELLGDALTGDPHVVGRHAHELQQLDIAMQVLGHLATVLQSADPIQSAERIGMAELSRRLTRKQL
jgi:hypothetical protein